MCQKKHQRLVSHHLFPLPLTLFLGHIPVPATPLGEHALIYRWCDLKKRAWGRTPSPKDIQPRGFFNAIPAQKLNHSLGALGLFSLQEGWPGSGGCELMQKGAGSPGLLGLGAHWLTHPLQHLDTPHLGPKPDEAPGMRHQPSPQRQKRSQHFCLSFFFFSSII